MTLKKAEYIRVYSSLAPEIKKQFDAVCSEQEVDRSSLIRRLIREYLQSLKGNKENNNDK